MPARWTSGQCPVCGSTITGRQRTCTACGLDLVADELAKIAYTARFLRWARDGWLLDDRTHVRLQQALDGGRQALTQAAWPPAPGEPAPAGLAPAEPPASPRWTGPPTPRRTRTPRPVPRHASAPAAWLRRVWGSVASDLGVHGLAYLGVLLMFAGTLGLALFSLRSVNAGLRPLAEVSLPLVLLVSAWFLGRRGAPLVAASLELLGGAVLPIVGFASLLDGSGVPPDLRPGPLLVVVLAVVAAGLGGVYALIARWRPATTLRYLVGPLAWTAVSVLGLAFHSGPSAAQMALVSLAVTATLLVARRWPAHRLSRPAELASIPGAALAMALVLAFAAAQGWPLWPALAATAATLATVELLAGRFPAAAPATLAPATLAQSLVLGIGLASTAPRLGWATSGTVLLAGTLALLEWHARRRQDPLVALSVLAVAAAGLALALAEPWTAVAAGGAAAAWAHARRIRSLPGPFAHSADWAAAVALAGCLAPLALVSGLERALPAGMAWVVLAGLAVAAALAVRRWRPGDDLAGWLVPAAAALAVLGTMGDWLAAPAPAPAPAGWLALAAGLAGLALAVTPRRPVLRTWSAAAALGWSLALGLEAAGVSPMARQLLWAALGLVLVAAAIAWRGRISGHLAAIGHLFGLGALAGGLSASRAVGTAVLATWVASWLLATVAAELGAAPLVDLLVRVAGERTRLSRAARGLLALMMAAGLAPLVVMAADLAGLLQGPARQERSGLALALLALMEGALAGRLVARRPLAGVLALAGVTVSAAAIALSIPGQWFLITALASGIGVVVLLGPRLRRRPMSWWAWALTAPLALLLADEAGVAGNWLHAVLGAWGTLLLLGGLLLDDLMKRRREAAQWLRLGGLDAPVVLGALGLAAAIASAASEQPLVFAVWCLVGTACSLVVAWRRGWAWGLVGAVLTPVGAAPLGPGWLALALAATAVGTALAAARSGHPLRGGLQASSVVVGAGAWLELLDWASWSSELAIGLTALAAGALACGVAAALRAGRAASDWATPVGLLATAAIVGVLLVGREPGAVVGVPDGWSGLAVAGGVAMLAAAAGLAAAPLGLAALRPATGLLSFGAAQVLLAAVRISPARWALATMTLAIAATASCLALWWPRRRVAGGAEPAPADQSGWSWGASWLGALVPLAAAAAAAGLLAAAVDGRRGLLAAGLLVIALEAAAGSLLLARPGLARLAPVLACGSWLELTAEAIGGDPQWLTVPVGLTVLVVVEMTRAQRRHAGPSSGPELRLLEYAGMLLVVGVALVQTVTRAASYGLAASLLAIGLCAWGAATRVRRRVAVGSLALLLALFGMIALPLAQLVPDFRGAALWIVLTAAGLVLVAVAVSLEQGRARLASAVGRIDQLMQGWE